MSTPEINQVLAQMRVARAQASGGAAVDETAQTDFRDLLRKSIDAVNDTQQNASALRTSFERGDDSVDLAQVMIAVQKSSISFEAMVQVRNKLVEAYKDVMNMPV
ncbi:MAG: flagellar hook-basal body complex protein FliE [Sedimenticolaceae bacterium]|nr:flagellar hook-basal body complex protein FliE [Chromatiaceae bacterium]MCP5439405.1 flagellar hook-basal body complex protein FliE [Chromatiaceae bacterium]HPE78417.1 flagellar hook-basal body complex protein FliE [Gammaproteobacteria bacterium]